MLCLGDELAQRSGLVAGRSQPDAAVESIGALDCAVCGYLVGDDANVNRMEHALDKGPGPVHREHADVPAPLPRQLHHLDEALPDGDGAAGNLVPAHLEQVLRGQAGEEARLVDPVERRILGVLEAGQVDELLLRLEALALGGRVAAGKGFVVVAVGLDDGVPGGLEVLLVGAALEVDCGLGELEDCVFDGDGAVEVEDEIHFFLFVVIV